LHALAEDAECFSGHWLSFGNRRAHVQYFLSAEKARYVRGSKSGPAHV